MIISRTPFRISFFGGGTDYPHWYKKNGGTVLSTSIDKYCYISCRTLPPFFHHRFRVVYSKIEESIKYDEIKHPAVREALRFVDQQQGLEIHHDGDLPARSGMGSSSSFTVGLLHTLYALKGKMPCKKQLASESIYIEQEMIKEAVGSQDQVCAAYGGLNQIIFKQDGTFEVRRIILPAERTNNLNDHLMLFYTGIKRTAADIAKSYQEDPARKHDILHTIQGMVEEAVDILKSDCDIHEFGMLLNKTWHLKKQLSPDISNDLVDNLYGRAIGAGAVGGKITGAGGGGFLLLFVPPAKQKAVREELGEKIHVPFRFESHGSQIIFYETQKNYSEIEKDRAKRKIDAFQELGALSGGVKIKCQNTAQRLKNSRMGML